MPPPLIQMTQDHHAPPANPTYWKKNDLIQDSYTSLTRMHSLRDIYIYICVPAIFLNMFLISRHRLSTLHDITMQAEEYWPMAR